jgi:hypothetical protein
MRLVQIKFNINYGTFVHEMMAAEFPCCIHCLEPSNLLLLHHIQSPLDRKPFQLCYLMFSKITQILQLFHSKRGGCGDSRVVDGGWGWEGRGGGWRNTFASIVATVIMRARIGWKKWQETVRYPFVFPCFTSVCNHKLPIFDALLLNLRANPTWYNISLILYNIFGYTLKLLILKQCGIKFPPACSDM